jgi:D-arginine dehydrogenase
MTTVDVVVIGAGLAGLSAGAELARDRRVVVLETESAPAQHTTGRSAAAFIEGYGGHTVSPFTRASRAWFESGGDGALDRPLLVQRGMLVVRAPGDPVDPEVGAEPSARLVTVAEAVELFPALRQERVAGATFVPDVADLDAAGVVGAFRRILRDRGGSLVTSAPVQALASVGGGWRVTTSSGGWECDRVVNAAGAWADMVAALAGLPPVGLRPMRRTICLFPVPGDLGHTRWPMLVDEAERFYLKPEPGQFLASPADETPSAPGDPRPDMLDIATALERVREATTLEARSVSTSWAGLRTFAPDRALVLGPDPLEPRFVWCAGQGGFGIQSAPAVARAIVSLMDRGVLPADIVAGGGHAASILPDRLRGASVSDSRGG